ncbi:GNAT family N-acetyltransferase [Alicyclobacillus herbarius]|uniref:GNAT family N-acetyltransferase n=1 Tax=Alicyclobacillus herbarius TaxID=122960 RepID=UPI000422BBD4|nr:GNAT family N-acetyltransferase [Alicyclobacillus herbarius]
MAAGLRKWVSVLSVMTAVAGFTGCVVLRLRGVAIPLWDIVLMIYGGVFCLFLFFDSASRGLAQARQAADARRRVPPRRTLRPEQQVVVTGSRLEVKLTRARREDAEVFQQMADTAVAEVLALQNQRPADHPELRVMDARAWLESSGMYAFFILADDDCVGNCAVDAFDTTARIRLFYVASPWRRQHVGRQAMRQLLEFLSLTGVEEVLVEFAPENLRARNFFAVCGFRPAAAGADETNLWRSLAHQEPVHQGVGTSSSGDETSRG